MAGLIQKTAETLRKHRLFVYLFFVQLSFVRCVAIETVDYRSRVIGTCINVACARAHTEVGGGTGSIAANNKAQGKQCKTKQCVLKELCVRVS